MFALARSHSSHDDQIVHFKTPRKYQPEQVNPDQAHLYLASNEDRFVQFENPRKYQPEQLALIRHTSVCATFC